MPKVTLEFEVTEKGAKVSQVVGDAEKALARLKDTSAASAQGLERVTGAGEGASLSFRTMRMGVTDLALAMGGANPQIANLVLGLGHVTDRMSGLSGMAKLLGGGIVAAGAGVAWLTSKFAEMDQAIEWQVKLNDSVRRFDTSGMVSQLKAVGLELEVEAAKGKTWWRSLKLSPGFAAEDSEFGEVNPITVGEVASGSKIEKLKKKQEDLRAAIEKTAGLSFEQDILKVSARFHAAQYSRATLTGPNAVADMTARVQAEETAAKRQLDILKEIATGQATTEQERTRIAVAASFERLAIEEEAKNRIIAGQRAIAAAQESVRVTLSDAAAQQQSARLQSLQSQVGPMESRNQRMADWRIANGFGVSRATFANPAASQVIEAEKAANLSNIDEALTRQLAAIKQMQVADEDRIQMVAARQAEADAKRLAALDAAKAKEDELAATIESKYQAALAKAGEAIKSNITDRLTEAQQAGDQLANSIMSGLGGMSGGGQPGSVAGALQRSGSAGMSSWWNSTELSMAQGRLDAIASRWGITIPANMQRAYLELQLRGGVGQTQIENELARIGREQSLIRTPSEQPMGFWGANYENYDEGGVVPGPPGSAHRAIVHGGETVIPAGKGGGDLVVHFSLDGRSVMQSIRVPLEQAYAHGYVRIGPR